LSLYSAFMEKIIDFITEKYTPRQPAGTVPSFIIIHGTEVDEQESLAILRGQTEYDASCHYMIAEDGRIFYLVDEKNRAWHAGKSFWGGEADMNSHSIGIEMVSVSKSAKFDDNVYTPEQLDALAELIADIKTRYDIPDWHILGHRDIAPIYRDTEPHYRYDPGVSFPWRELAEKGHGIWPLKAHEQPWDEMPVTDEDSQKTFFDAMGHFGYDTRDLSPENRTGLIRALRIHYAPEAVGYDASVPTKGDWLLIKELLKEKLF